ncbi:MAG TPA: efflux RND transporter periplasmic adaptor subunit [Anaeromyxobacteraceae bacterium]|nr:efflux RND transporter periplasmic adaptor subunit [Anaeromyxobacteraceae bacterium]
MKIKTKLWIGIVAGLLLVVGTLGAVKAAQIGSMIKAGKSFVPAPESVATAKVEAVEWAATRAAVATLVAIRGVTLSAELPGTVREIGFQSGTFVRKGSPLVKLDTSAEEAQLASAAAEASLARINLERAQALRRAESNTQADLDTAEARAKQADAAVQNLQATVAKKTIRAPFDGRIAIRQVELGQVLSPGTPIASLQSVSPIHAEFWVPQQALAQLRLRQRVTMRVDIFPGSSWEGEVTTINPEVDVATRNVRARATFENADGRLQPGMFANVEVVSSEKRQALVVPVTAVIYAPYGDSVFVLERKGDGAAQGKEDAAAKGKEDAAKGKADGPAQGEVARQRSVRLGERRGDFVEVLTGLTGGETVVSGGAFKLRNGMAVAVNNALAPDVEVAPKPTDR